MIEKTQWHRALETALLVLDDCTVECDGMTWCINRALRDAEVPHAPMCGLVRYEPCQAEVHPHYWVQLPDGWIVDLRLRMWFGPLNDVPHGVFHPDNDPTFTYVGKPTEPPTNLRIEALDVLTNGVLTQVKIPAVGSKR